MGWFRRTRSARRPHRRPLHSPQTRAFTFWPALFAVVNEEPSQVRQNYHQDCEAAVNRHINLELYSSFVYQSMAYHFERDEVALKNFASYFLRHSHKEHENAKMLLKVQNQRGGNFELRGIRRPDLRDWGSGFIAMQCALHLEQTLNQSLLDLYQLATEKCDPQLCHFLKSHFLNEKVKTIKELGDHVTNLRRLGAPVTILADYFFDKFILG